MGVIPTPLSSMANKTLRSEEEPGQKWDRCVADIILKTGARIFLLFTCALCASFSFLTRAGVGFGLGGFFTLLVIKSERVGLTLHT